MDYSKVLIGAADDLQCPRCKEKILVEHVQTHRKREAYCSVCGHTWIFEVPICRCGVVPIGHHHDDVDLLPPCPKCGKRVITSVPL